MYVVTKKYGHNLGLSACFRQWRATSHCRHLHGYALAFTLTFVAPTLDARNWVIDFGGLKEVKEYLGSVFDHKLVVAADDPHIDELTMLAGLDVADVLVLENVGCEAFAKLVYDHVSKWLLAQGYENGVRLLSVECREHESNSAAYVENAR